MNEVMLRTNGVRTLVLDIRDADDAVPYKDNRLCVVADSISARFCGSIWNAPLQK